MKRRLPNSCDNSMRAKFSCPLQALLRLAVPLILAGCELDFPGLSSTRSETTLGLAHTVKQSSNGVSRTIQYSGKFMWDQDKILEISPGCVVRLVEEKFGKKTVAEIREVKGEPVLWVQKGSEFRVADASEKAWLEHFLRSVGSAPSDVGTVESAIKKRMADPGDADFLVPLQRISFGGDKATVLKRIVTSQHLTPARQVAVIQACFQHVSHSSDQVSVLLALLNRPDFSPAAKVALRGQVDRLSFDSDKITVLKALSAK